MRYYAVIDFIFNIKFTFVVFRMTIQQNITKPYAKFIIFTSNINANKILREKMLELTEKCFEQYFRDFES